jgi:hypothetical protein
VNSLQEVLLIFGVLILGVCLWVWHYGRARQTLTDWAADSGLELIRAEVRFFRRGPFFWRSGRGHTIYYIVVRNGDGQTRSGYARVGGWLLGVLSREVMVRWE